MKELCLIFKHSINGGQNDYFVSTKDINSFDKYVKDKSEINRGELNGSNRKDKCAMGVYIEARTESQ